MAERTKKGFKMDDDVDDDDDNDDDDDDDDRSKENDSEDPDRKASQEGVVSPIKCASHCYPNPEPSNSSLETLARILKERGRFKQGSQDKRDSSRGQKRSRWAPQVSEQRRRKAPSKVGNNGKKKKRIHNKDDDDDDDDNVGYGDKEEDSVDVQFDKEETKNDDHKKTELKEVSSGRSPSSSEKNRAEPTQDQSVKQGTPSYDELERLASKLGDVWKKLGRRLGIEEPKLDEVSKLNEELSEKGYKMLRHWKGLNGSAATYQILVQALQHELVNLRDLAEEFCYEQQ